MLKCSYKVVVDPAPSAIKLAAAHYANLSDLQDAKKHSIFFFFSFY